MKLNLLKLECKQWSKILKKDISSNDLWNLLKSNAVEDTKRANSNEFAEDDRAISIFDPINNKYILFLSKETYKIEQKLIGKLPKNRIKLTDKQKINEINNVLCNLDLKKLTYQKLLELLHQKSSNKVTYLFGLTNIMLDIDQDFKINDEFCIGSFAYSHSTSYFSDFILQNDFAKKENSYLLVTVTGPDDMETVRKAEKKANTLVNVLNSLCCNQAEPIKIMTQADEKVSMSAFFYFKKVQHWSESNTLRPGKLLNYTVVNKDDLNIIKTIYINRTKHNKFNKLIFSMNWLGNSIKETDYGSAFLEVVIGLECIAEKQSKGLVSPSINYQISNFVAMILGENIEDRKLLITKMKKIYEKRSQIVHDGQSNVTYEDYVEVFDLVRNLITRLIYDVNFKNISDLNVWVDDKLLS